MFTDFGTGSRQKPLECDKIPSSTFDYYESIVDNDYEVIAMTVKDMNTHTERLEKARFDLIQAEATGISHAERKQLRGILETAILNALKGGLPVETISESSGLRVEDIRDLEAASKIPGFIASLN